MARVILAAGALALGMIGSAATAGAETFAYQQGTGTAPLVRYEGSRQQTVTYLGRAATSGMPEASFYVKITYSVTKCFGEASGVFILSDGTGNDLSGTIALNTYSNTGGFGALTLTGGTGTFAGVTGGSGTLQLLPGPTDLGCRPVTLTGLLDLQPA